MRLANSLCQRQLVISFKTYKKILILSLALIFLLAGCSPFSKNNLEETSYIRSDHMIKTVKSISHESKTSLLGFDYINYSQSISNFFSSPEINNMANFFKPYIEELFIYIPQIESAGIILKDIYTDLNPLSPLLILEFKLDAVDQEKLDNIVSNSIDNKQKLSAGLELLRSAVQVSKLKIGQFSIDRVQVRIGLYPPFASTRIQYSRG